MSIREELVLKALAGEESKVDLAAEFGVSRKTVYKWLDRYKERGLAGLVDESRRPRSSPMMTSPELALAAVQLRKAHRSWGPKKIVAVLARQYPGDEIPSVSTTSRILRQAGFVTRPHRRSSGGFPAAPRHYSPVEPNDLWTVDFKGWWRTLDGARCDPLTVRDAVSRYMLALRAMPRTRTEDVRPVFEELFDRYGLPRAIHSDNGPPFASLRGPGGLTQLSAWWVSLGIEVVRSRPGKPQDNGGHERMHLDVRFELEDVAAATLADQQRAFHEWVTTFNHVRPHEALGQRLPGEVYRVSERRLARCVPFVHPDDRRLCDSTGKASSATTVAPSTSATASPARRSGSRSSPTAACVSGSAACCSACSSRTATRPSSRAAPTRPTPRRRRARRRRNSPRRRVRRGPRRRSAPRSPTTTTASRVTRWLRFSSPLRFRRRRRGDRSIAVTGALLLGMGLYLLWRA